MVCWLRWHGSMAQGVDKQVVVQHLQAPSSPPSGFLASIDSLTETSEIGLMVTHRPRTTEGGPRIVNSWADSKPQRGPTNVPRTPNYSTKPISGALAVFLLFWEGEHEVSCASCASLENVVETFCRMERQQWNSKESSPKRVQSSFHVINRGGLHVSLPGWRS